MLVEIGKSVEILNGLLEQEVLRGLANWVESALRTMINFQSTYQIKNCSIEEESDELLAEFGTYCWDPSENQQFEFSFTRQIRLKSDDEFHQIKIVLIFDPEEFNDIKSMSIWSMDYESISDWSEAVRSTGGYQRSQGLKVLDYEISITET